MGLKIYLIVTGIGAFLALAFPSLVVIGLFMLVIPGLILGMMPTAFMYGVLFGVVRFVLSGFLSGIPLNALAAVLTVAIFWTIPQPGLLLAKRQLDDLNLPDITPDEPVELGGDILVSRPFELRCDSLCAALLKTPGVTSVRVTTDGKHSRTYRLIDNKESKQSEKAIGFGFNSPRKSGIAGGMSHLRALEAEWNTMLASGRILAKSDHEPEPDFTFVLTNGPIEKDETRGWQADRWSFRNSIPNRQLFELRDRDGEVLLRKSMLEVSAIAAPIMIDANGSIENFHFRWARKRFSHGKRHYDSQPTDLILESTNIARGVDEAAAIADARATLETALNDPALDAGNAAFALAAQWMESFRSDDVPMSDADRDLVLQIVADRRVPNANGFWAVVKRMGDRSRELRTLATERFLATDDPKWMNTLDGLPEGAFADPLPLEIGILSDPAKSVFTTTLIARQGERGTEAIPDLLRLLEEHSTRDAGKYGYARASAAISAVRKGFRRIGADAAPARERIETLITAPAMERRYNGFDKRDWDTLLVVLGKPVETLEKPDNLSGTTDRYRSDVAERARKPYNPSDDKG